MIASLMMMETSEWCHQPRQNFHPTQSYCTRFTCVGSVRPSRASRTTTIQYMTAGCSKGISDQHSNQSGRLLLNVGTSKVRIIQMYRLFHSCSSFVDFDFALFASAMVANLDDQGFVLLLFEFIFHMLHPRHWFPHQ